MKTKKKKLRYVETALIKRIIDRLFTTGRADKLQATRLVLVHDGKGFKDMGGWCREAIRDVLIEELARPEPPKA